MERRASPKESKRVGGYPDIHEHVRLAAAGCESVAPACLGPADPTAALLISGQLASWRIQAPRGTYGCAIGGDGARRVVRWWKQARICLGLELSTVPTVVSCMYFSSF